MVCVVLTDDVKRVTQTATTTMTPRVKTGTDAVDAVTFPPSPISDWRCSFETTPTLDGLTWCSMEQSDNDDFNWKMMSTGTPSKPTGPKSANSLPYYIYVEASHRNKNDKAEYVW